MKTYLLLLTLISASAHAEWERILDEKTYSIASDGERLYTSTEKGMYYSRDDGDTWRRGDFKDLIVYLTASPDAVYGYSYDHGIMRSVTKGNTWHPKNTGFELRWWENGRWKTRTPRAQQFLITSSGMVIAVCYHQGTWISRDRGETWHSVYDEWIYPGNPDWHFGDSIFSMTEFDGYLWAVWSSSSEIVLRSPDKGETWEILPNLKYGEIADWAVLDDRLYVAGSRGFGRWNEAEFMWENLSQGLPDEPYVNQLAVNRGRIYAGSWRHGVFMFDHHSKTWRPAGLSGVSIVNLVTHHGNLYAALEDGIYRVDRPFVSIEGKAAVTWGSLKTK